MNSRPSAPHLVDLAAFVAVLVTLTILILVGHASAELLTTLAAGFSGVFSLWHRSSGPRPEL